MKRVFSVYLTQNICNMVKVL